MKSLSRFISRTTILLLLSGAAWAGSPQESALKAQYPALYELYRASATYQPALAEYANRQGFRAPYENLATVVHEMIHIASAVHRGYFIDGVFYEPYLTRDGGAPPWPQLNNNTVHSFMLPEERSVIWSIYMPNTPNNNLGNVLDEINAHSHVAGFVCVNEPDSGSKQVRNLAGHLNLQEAYLRVLRLARPNDYLALSNDRESRGALVAITTKAWATMQKCGVSAAAIPWKEAKFFMSIDKESPRKAGER